MGYRVFKVAAADIGFSFFLIDVEWCGLNSLFCTVRIIVKHLSASLLFFSFSSLRALIVSYCLCFCMCGCEKSLPVGLRCIKDSLFDHAACPYVCM